MLPHFIQNTFGLVGTVTKDLARNSQRNKEDPVAGVFSFNTGELKSGAYPLGVDMSASSVGDSNANLSIWSCTGMG